MLLLSMDAEKTVLHATWHPQHDAIFTVSFDRTIGLSTFR